MGSELGYDIVGEYYREFLNTGRIEDLGTYVSAFYSTFDNSGYYYYILTITPSERFDEMRSADVEEARSRDREIAALLSSASAHYRANEDIMALSDVLSAVSLSLDGSIEYSADELLDRAMSYLGNIELDVNRDGEVIAKRTKGIFHPYIISGKIDASYERINADGERERATVTCQTDSRGRFVFTVTDPYTIRQSDVIFSVSLPLDAMREIEQKAPDGFMDDFYRLFSERGISYRTEGYMAYPADETVIGVAFYDENGNVVAGDNAYGMLSSVVSSVGADYLVAKASGDDDEGVYINMLTMYPERRYFVLFRIGITDTSPIASGWAARSDARVLLVDKTQPESAYEQSSSAVARGSTKEEAEDNALTRSASVAAGMILSRI